MATEKSPKREIAEAEQERKPPLQREENIDEHSKREMARARDLFRQCVAAVSYDRWKCKYCGKQFSRGVTTIGVHLVGCKGVDDQVRSEALKVFGGRIAVESTNRQGNVKGSAMTVTAINEDACRKTSSDAMSYVIIGPESIPSSPTEAPPYEPPEMESVMEALIEPQDSVMEALIEPPDSVIEALLKPQDIAMEDLSAWWANEAEFVENRESYGESIIEVTQDARTQGKRSFCGPAIKSMTSLKRKQEEPMSSGVANVNESKWKKLEGCSLVQAIEEAGSVPPEKAAEVDKLFEELWATEEVGSLPLEKAAEVDKPLKELRAIEEARSLPLEKAVEVDKVEKPFKEFKETSALAKGCSRRSPLVTTELVGRGTHRKIDEIYSYLMHGNISIIGVIGMAGVGKTAILMHVHNNLLEDHIFDDVLWVTVPSEFSTYALQEEIANAIGLHNLSNEKNVKRRASILYGHLKMKKSVLILDGLWMHFKVKDVGIPVEMGSVKLVLSTRSLDVCCMMLCQKQIKIELLDREESWRLFLKALCFAGKLPSDVEEIAKSIVHKCEGLPLGIIEIATCMRGVEEVNEWEGMLQKFKDSRIELDVLKRLKLSYMNLGDHQVQQCFLHLALCFGEDLSETNRDHFIESFIDEGLLDGIATLQELHNQGNIIFDKMRRACLLDDLEEEYLYLHPLTRYMALHMVTSKTHMVKAYMGLKEIPEEVFWTDCLERVFLQGNKIEEITCSILPNCPKLTRLLLNDNVMLGNIHTSFFINLKLLRNLDLSNTQIRELPESVCHLDKLEVLLLRRCRALKLIPHVGKLRELRKLDLHGCSSLDEVPEGMEMLVNLRYLDLYDTKIETLPEGVLGNLVNLHYLVIKKVTAGEGAKLKKLEALDCSVPDVKTFNVCVRILEQNSSQRYKLMMDGPYYCESETQRRIFIDSCDHITASVDGTSGDGCALIPESVQSLGVSRCHKMKRVMGWEWMITHLPKLEEIIVYNCDELEEIMSGPLPSSATCFLTYLGVNGCKNIKGVLLTQDMLLHLPFLQEISVEDCKGIEVIIGTAANRTHFFPKLIHLGLWNLPELKSICDGTMSCDSLRWISIYNCPKLRRISLQLSLLDNGLPSPPPSLQEIRIDQQTWESLEWDHPLARDSLRDLVRGSWFD